MSKMSADAPAGSDENKPSSEPVSGTAATMSGGEVTISTSAPTMPVAAPTASGSRSEVSSTAPTVAVGVDTTGGGDASRGTANTGGGVVVTRGTGVRRPSTQE